MLKVTTVSLVKDNQMKKIVRFTASWCQPCKMLAKTLEDIELNMPMEVIDIDENTDMAIKNNVRGVPTLIMFDGDKELKRMSGLVDQRTLKNWIEA